MNALTPAQQGRFQKIHELAARMGNMSLAMVQTHLNPYRDLSRTHLKHVEDSIREGFMSALLEEETPVLIWARDCAVKSFDFATRQGGRGRLTRLLAKKKWFENNWEFFSEPVGFKGRRCIFVFLTYDESSLSRLVAPWWDPNVLTNSSVASSPSLVKEAKTRLKPGTIAFSLGLKGLRSCEIFFHPDDVAVVPETVCRNANKQDWWKD